MTADELAARFPHAKKMGDGYMVHCPVHDDRDASLSVKDGDDGRVLLHCFAGCPYEAVVAALGLEPRDLAPDRGGEGGFYTPSKTRAIVPSQSKSAANRPKNDGTADCQRDAIVPSLGCTLADYAEAKGLPPDFLTALGLSDMTYQKAPALRVPYMDRNGDTGAVRFRLRLARDGSGQGFAWKSGTKVMPYGVWRLEEARRAGSLTIVEGESDAQTLWFHGLPALGVPGANTWRPEWSELLDDIDRVYVVVEPDSGGESVLRWLSASPLRERAHVVYMPTETKDPSDLYLSDREGFRANWRRLLESAVPWIDEARHAAETAAREAWNVCQDLAMQPRILDRLPDALAARAVVGEAKAAQLVYLALVTRFDDRPVSVAVKGPSSGGKSWLTQAVVDLFPPSAVFVLTGMSEHVLAYLDEPMSHRFLVLFEAAGLYGDLATYLVRSLVSEGCIRYATVEKTKDGLRPRTIHLEGPTGLLLTTTRAGLDAELETRLLSVGVTDTPEQTRAVLQAIAKGKRQDASDVTQWHALQTWLEGAEHRVAIPYGDRLAALVRPVAVRLRRDFCAVLTLVRAHARLHQARRERDDEGRIIATVDDYAAVRDLVSDLVAEGVGATVSTTTREAVEAVARLHGAEPVTYKRLARDLGIDPSAARRRALVAMAGGFLKNDETRRGQTAKLSIGEPMPDEVEVLPRPEALSDGTMAKPMASRRTPETATLAGVSGCDGTMARETEGIDNPPSPLPGSEHHHDDDDDPPDGGVGPLSGDDPPPDHARPAQAGGDDALGSFPPVAADPRTLTEEVAKKIARGDWFSVTAAKVRDHMPSLSEDEASRALVELEGVGYLTPNDPDPTRQRSWRVGFDPDDLPTVVAAIRTRSNGRAEVEATKDTPTASPSSGASQWAVGGEGEELG